MVKIYTLEQTSPTNSEGRIIGKRSFHILFSPDWNFKFAVVTVGAQFPGHRDRENFWTIGEAVNDVKRRCRNARAMEKSKAVLNVQYDNYQEEKAEARACGNLDFPTFAEWSGQINPREAAEQRIKEESQ